MENSKCVACNGFRLNDQYNNYCEECYLKSIDDILEYEYRQKNERENNE